MLLQLLQVFTLSYVLGAHICACISEYDLFNIKKHRLVTHKTDRVSMDPDTTPDEAGGNQTCKQGIPCSHLLLTNFTG